MDLRYRKMLCMTAFVIIAQPALCIFLVIKSTDKVSARILGMVIVSCFAYSYCFWNQIKSGKKIFIKHYWKYALSLCIPLIPHYLSQIIMSTSDRIMIDRIIGSKEAGIYSLAYSISQIMTIFNTGLMQTIEPWLYKKIKKGELKNISAIAYKSMVGIALVNILLIIFAPEVVRIFAPEEYYEAIWIIPPVAMSVYVSFMYAFFAVFDFYYEKTKYISFATLVGAVINIVLNYLLIPVFGYYAAGYTTLFCYIIYVVMHYYFMSKICKENQIDEIPYDKNVLISISFVFFVISFVILFTYKHYLVRYSIMIVLMLAIFIMRKRIISIIRRIIRDFSR